jgi:hypothetical protein
MLSYQSRFFNEDVVCDAEFVDALHDVREQDDWDHDGLLIWDADDDIVVVDSHAHVLMGA